MSIVHDPNHNPSSAGATYEWLYVAPAEITEKVGINRQVAEPRLMRWPTDQAGCATGAGVSRRTIRLQLTTTANNRYCNLARSRPR
jgi:hypothetical protein